MSMTKEEVDQARDADAAANDAFDAQQKALCTAPGAADLTFGSLLSEMISAMFRRVETADPNARHRVYLECRCCGGTDEDRVSASRPSQSAVKHDTRCLMAKHLPRLRAMANKDVT